MVQIVTSHRPSRGPISGCRGYVTLVLLHKEKITNGDRMIAVQKGNVLAPWVHTLPEVAMLKMGTK